MKRVFLIVLDSLGIGAMPDAADFGDNNPNTLKSISKSSYFNCENLLKMGLGSIDGVDYLKKSENIAAFGRCKEKSKGKDTTIGHWEIAGVVSPKPLPTYPGGFPDYIIKEFCEKTGRGVLCNKPYSGTEVIKDYGEEHLKTGKLIVYTSADSVFQIAASEDIIPWEELYRYCKIAREILSGENAVGRVIARPFKKENGVFVRTDGRHDFSLAPPKDTMLDAIKNSGKTVYAIGKINDIFAGCGITEKCFTVSNKDGMQKTLDAVKNKDFEGICFTNLVDFDMLYGHRRDINGYALALAEFDAWLPLFIKEMKADDLLIITADHGCDPAHTHTDHTREHTPLIIYSKGIKPENLGTRETFSDIAATVCAYLGVDFKCAGKTVLKG